MYKAIVIGVSSGGMNVLKTLLPALPGDFHLPVIIVQHVSPSSDNYWIGILDKMCRLKIKEAEEKESIEKGFIYVAPANYHLLIEKDYTFSLSVDKRVNYARPSIDVLFESAAEVYKDELIGIILTGSNHDGSMGLKKIKEAGGLTIVQEPSTAESPFMPASALKTTTVDHSLSIHEIIQLLTENSVKL